MEHIVTTVSRVFHFYHFKRFVRNMIDTKVCDSKSHQKALQTVHASSLLLTAKIYQVHTHDFHLDGLKTSMRRKIKKLIHRLKKNHKAKEEIQREIIFILKRGRCREKEEKSERE